MAVIKSRYFKTVLPLSVLLALYSYSYAHGEKQHESEPETFDAVTTEFGRYKPELEPSQSIDISMADTCLLYTSPSPRDATLSRMPSSA